MQLIPNNFFIPSKYISFKNIINIKFKNMYELALKNGKKIQIDQNDFAKQLNWSTAKLKCEEIGEGWRLPTISELEEIFENKEQYNFANYGYWTYWSIEELNEEESIAFSGVEGNVITELKEAEFYVRAVKNI